MSDPSLPILVLDDEELSLRGFEITLRADGFDNLICLQDSRQALPMLESRDIGVLLMDLTMPYLSGEELLPRIIAEAPQIPVLVITGANDVETAVRCIKAGAADYLVKPVERSRLLTAVRRALELRELQRENALLKSRLLSGEFNHPEAFRGIITQHRTLLGIFQYLETIAKTRQPVLITGETGVGKQLFARSIHQLSGLKGAFIEVDVAGLDENMFSDTLFGHKKGAFTGAADTRAGLVKQAAGGTLFLDEIGDLAPASQVKLLRLLQEHEYYPLGSDMPQRTDARIVVATNQDLQQRMSSGLFRKDLFYRLRTHHVHIPPLRERTDDLPLLVDYLIEEAAQTLQIKKPSYPNELIDLLSLYPFPGNVRELRAFLMDAVSKHPGGVLSLKPFREALFPRGDAPETPSASAEGESPSDIVFGKHLPTLKEVSRRLTQEAMRRAKGNQTTAARMIGITQQALSKRLAQQDSDTDDRA